MSKKRKQQTSTEEMSWVLESDLEPGMLRFMAHVIENGLNAGLRTEEDFVRHFPPTDIMNGLADRPDLRANILVPTTGVRPKIASKKSAESAGVDLQIALEEGETDASVIISLFHPDDRVRYLDHTRLWNYITEPKFWRAVRTDQANFDRAKQHIAFTIDRAIEDRLLSHREIVEGITVARLVKHLPPTDLQAVIEGALASSHDAKPFTEEDLLDAVPSEKLVDHVPLSTIWESVIVPMVAERNGLIEGKTTPSLQDVCRHRVVRGGGSCRGAGRRPARRRNHERGYGRDAGERQLRVRSLPVRSVLSSDLGRR